ncbi:MAG: type II toxin-antitoxin system prevent-host-death family antitoxin [Gammaproteobacteria bacterium]
MKYLSTRELRNTPGAVRDQVREDDLVLTANGKPVAVLIGVEDGNLDETLRVIRQVRGQQALTKLQRDAVARGLDEMTLDEINAEIRAARSDR